MEKQLISLVVPCFNEEEVLPETIKRLVEFCRRQSKYRFEIIFVDDGSIDKSLSLLTQYNLAYTELVKVVSLARNFGHQIAVTAGIDVAQGEALVIIDCDLQDPPELIHEMLLRWQEGYEVVYALRKKRQGESGFKRLSAATFYRLLNRFSDTPIPLDTGDFRLIDKKVAAVIRNMPEHARFIRGMVSWVGFKQIAVPFERAERFAGVTKYPFLKMLKLATDGILSFSTKPLKVAIIIGFASALLALLAVICIICWRFFTQDWVAGWATIMIAVFFIGGVQLICIGILGEYIGRIYTEVQGRPLYTVSKTLGISKGK